MIASPAPVAPLASHQLLLFLLQAGVLLLLATILGRLAQRFGLPAVVGELLTGVLLGPSLLSQLVPSVGHWLLPGDPSQMHLLDALGQFSAVLLVAVAGLHIDVRLVRRRTGTIAALATGGLLLPLGLGVATGLLVPMALLPATDQRVMFALFLGVAMAVSAVPVIAKTLSDMRLMHRDVGQLILATASLDDALAWFMLSVISSMAVSALTVGNVLTSLLRLILFVAAAALIGRPAVRRAMRWANAQRDVEPAVAIAVITVLLFSAAGHALGLEAIFGALVAGVLLGLPGGVEPARLAPLRTVVLSVLAPLFLASAGLRVDVRALADPVVLLAGLVILVLAVLGKFFGAYLAARLTRQSHWEAVALGAGLNSRGVVEIVMGMVGLRLGILNTATYTIVLLVAVLTSVMAPPMLRRAMRRIEHTAEEALRENSQAQLTTRPMAV